jgi:hypothetical protein
MENALKDTQKPLTLQQQGNAAKAEKQRFAELLAAAKEDLASAETKSKQDSRSTESVVALMSAQLKVKDALETYEAYAAGVAQLIDDADAEADREQRIKDLEVAAAKATGGCFEQQKQRVEDLAANFRAALRGALVDAQDGIRQHNSHVAVANNLAEGLGRPERYTTRTLDDVIAAVSLSLNGGVQPAIGYPTAVDFKTFTTDGASESKRRFVITINEPLTK